LRDENAEFHNIEVALIRPFAFDDQIGVMLDEAGAQQP
jgi:hypothetical protein